MSPWIVKLILSLIKQLMPGGFVEAFFAYLKGLAAKTENKVDDKIIEIVIDAIKKDMCKP